MFLYRLLTIILSPVILGHIIWISVKNKQSRYFWQRLGFKYSNLPTKCLWFHCASVGEVITLLPLIRNIHIRNEKLKVIITTNTITGGKIVAQQQLSYLFHSYLPFDWVNSINQFLIHLKPDALYIMETEIWPNLFATCYKNGTPVTLINARLSSKTTNAKPWIKSILKHSLSNVHAIYTRTDKDKIAYLKLGADENNISTVGNLKLTTALNPKQEYENKITVNRDYILVASTHNNEEFQIYNTWKALNRSELLIIAPRHPERSATIVKQLDCDAIAIRSKNDVITDQTKVYLLDTIGELKNYFSNAQLVIMGGSFVPIGGHNILEPASFNSAIITGPHMENFREELGLLIASKAILQVSTMKELSGTLIKLLEDKTYKANLIDNTTKISHQTKKVLADYIKLIIPES